MSDIQSVLVDAWHFAVGLAATSLWVALWLLILLGMSVVWDVTHSPSEDAGRGVVDTALLLLATPASGLLTAIVGKWLRLPTSSSVHGP